MKLIYLADPSADKEAQLINNVIAPARRWHRADAAFPDADAPAVKAAMRPAFRLSASTRASTQWKGLGLSVRRPG